ncbi:MAG: LPP20 family lipoprotein [Nitrosomonadales bacterium]|nr:LPP20 family lipoprotein [Nitrosomonadales bacterium]
MTRLFIYLVAALLLLGCTGTGQKAADAGGIPGAPAWVMNPDKPGYTSVVGSAPKQDWGGRAAQLRVAEMKARQELAQIVRVQVESMNKFKTEDRSGSVSRTGDVETRLRSSVDLSLESARVIEEWTDPQSGELYIWLVTPN